MEYVGVPPIVDCGDGIHIPIYVNGEEVFEDQPPGTCDDPDFKGTCNVGSRVGRVEGVDINGNPMPEVVWVFFCRSAGQDLFEQMGAVSVQIIGYNTENGATCFFESPDAIGDNIQSQYLSYDDNGFLDGTFPSYGTVEFDQLFHSPAVSGTNCMSCHNSDPFIHDPWIDGAKLLTDPIETVVPKYEYDAIDLPYFAVGGYGSQYSNASIHIESNNCLSCHRSSMELATTVFDDLGNVLVNEFMPPTSPGYFEDDYNELIDCYHNGPENTPGCNWIIPPGGDCNLEIVEQEDTVLLGDLNNDLSVNIQDIIIAVNLIINNEHNSFADINLDGTVDVLDIIQIINIIQNDELHVNRKNNQYGFNHNYESKIDIVRNWIESFEK
tara:strand:- start:7979 stop:9124 length:1146 start_codon:yes stop_codon:yes gene_type:complete